MQTGILFAFASMFLLGTAKLTAKQAVNKTGKYQTAFLTHLTIAATTGMLFLLFDSRSFSVPPSLSIFLFTTAIGAAAILCLYYAFETGNIAIASSISQSSFALTALLLFLLFGRTLKQESLFGIALIFIGMLLLAVVKNNKISGIFHGTTAWSFGTFLGWGIFYTFVPGIIAAQGPFLGGFWIELFVFVFVALYLLLFRRRQLFSTRVQGLHPFLTGLQIGVGAFCLNMAISMINPSIAVTIMQSSILIPVVGGRIFFKERLNMGQMTTIGIILAGLILLA